MSRPARIVAIGLGPFNLGLAALAHPIQDATVTVLESKPAFTWHPGMMLESATIQVPFIADLVTFADPTSPHSFLNYLKHTGRLYSFYIRESLYPFRREYEAYCAWVAGSVPNIHYGQTVENVTWDDASSTFTVTASSRDGMQHFPADHIVVGTGTTPHIPEPLAVLDTRVLHTADYMERRDELLSLPDVLVVGSGQSSAEVYLDLLRRGASNLHWVTRSPRFFPMDTSPLTLEMTSPEYREHFLSLTGDQQAALRTTQVPLYKGISEATIREIFDELTLRGLDAHLEGGCDGGLGGTHTELQASVSVDGIEPTHESLRVALRHLDSDHTWTHNASAVVCGTGYTPAEHTYLDGVSHLLRDGTASRADADHSIDVSGRRIFVQNTREQPHPLTAADLGMGPLRNSEILRAITGRDVYHCEKRIAYQTFGAPRAEATS